MEENVNIKAAIIHIIGDIIQSIGVVIAAIIIYIKPHYKIVDPLCTFLFSVIVLFTTINITKQCLLILMECTPKKFYTEDIENELKHKVLNINNISLQILSVYMILIFGI